MADEAIVVSDAIDLLHKSHNAPVPYSTVHTFVTEMMHYGVCETKCFLDNVSEHLNTS